VAGTWGWHEPRIPWAAPLGPETLCLRAVTARGAFRRGWAEYGDRYGGPRHEVGLRLLGRERDRDHWEGHLHLPTRRFAYRLRWEDRRGAVHVLTPEGWGPGPDFHYPYIADGDLPSPPAWAAGAVLYQVFPDRFDNGDPRNDPTGVRPWGEPPGPRTFFGGDLAGVRRRLPYLADLGVRGLYLNPVFASPSTHRYDTTDYFSVDPALGTLAELRALVDEAHALGLKVILDGVFNHCGAGWPPFVDAVRRGPASPHWDWFRVAGAAITTDPPNYETFGNGNASMPKLMTHRPALRAYLLGVARYWIEHVGIDGWRLDVANEVDHAFWRAFRQAVREIRPDALLIGEVWHDPVAFLDGSEWDGATDYRFRGAVLDLASGRSGVAAFAAAMARLHAGTPPLADPCMMRLVGSHDVTRVRTEVGGDATRALLAAGLQLCWPGMPSIYYGDEVGMEGQGDPGARGCMQWEPDATGRAMHARYRTLCRLRRDHPALRSGGLREVRCDGRAGRYAFLRTHPDGDVLVAVNAGTRTWRPPVPAGAPRLDAEGPASRLLLPAEVGLWAVPRGAVAPGTVGAALDLAPADG
jgi:cyclomaltodextrinase